MPTTEAASTGFGRREYVDDSGAWVSASDIPELWDLTKETNDLIRRGSTSPADRVELARRRADAWARIAVLSVDQGDPIWYTAACACAAEVATEAAERMRGIRRPRPLL